MVCDRFVTILWPFCAWSKMWQVPPPELVVRCRPLAQLDSKNFVLALLSSKETYTCFARVAKPWVTASQIRSNTLFIAMKGDHVACFELTHGQSTIETSHWYYQLHPLEKFLWKAKKKKIREYLKYWLLRWVKMWENIMLQYHTF